MYNNDECHVKGLKVESFKVEGFSINVEACVTSIVFIISSWKDITTTLLKWLFRSLKFYS